MAKKGFIKDLNNIEILPITRGELVLDSSGKLALRSNKFLATDSLPGLMSKEDKAKLDKLNENGDTIDLVSATTDGLAPKIGTAAASTVTTQADEWVLTSTKGATPTWRKLPTNAFLNYYRPILVNGTSLLGNNNTALNIAAGTNINLTTDAGKVTINNGLTKLSDLTDDILSGKYLPLTGGDVNGRVKIINSNVAPFIVKTNIDAAGILLTSNSGSGYFLYYGDKDYYVTNNQWTNRYKIWHEGNDGSDSGLDADTLDGWHASNFIRYSNRIDVTLRALYSHVGYGYIANGWKTAGPAMSFGADSKYQVHLLADTIPNKNALYFRAVEDSVAQDWKTIAFTDYNGFYNLYGGISLIASESKIINLNDYKTPGTFNVKHSSSIPYVQNIPVNKAGMLLVILPTHTEGYLIQLYNPYNSNEKYLRYIDPSTSWSEWKLISTDLSTYNAPTTDKLKNKVQLWGNDFDGSLNISGSMYMDNNSLIHIKDTKGNALDVLTLNSNNLFALGWSSGAMGYSTNICGNSISFLTSTSNKNVMHITADGKVGIGTSSPIYKLDVNGVILSKGIVIGNELNYSAKSTEGKDISLMYLSSSNNLIIGKGVSDNGASTYVHGNGIIFRSKGSVIDLTMGINSHGNVTIGSSNLAGTTYKLYVDGSANISGSLTAATFLGNLDWSYITNKPTSFTPAAHDHTRIINTDTSGRGIEGTLLPSKFEKGLTFNTIYGGIEKSWPVNYGNVVTIRGNGDNLIVISWNASQTETNTNVALEMYIRSKRDSAAGDKWSDWTKVITDRNYPEYCAPKSHTHTSNQITALTGYSKATSASDLVTTDTLNIALGKLEYKAGIAYSWYRTITEDDTDTIINKWDEVVDFVNNLEVDLTEEFVTRKTALTITGLKTFKNNQETLVLRGSDIVTDVNTYGGWARGTYFNNTSGDTTVSAVFGVYGLGIGSDGSKTNIINYLYLAHLNLDWTTATFKVYGNKATINDLEVYHKGNLKKLSDLTDDIVSGKYLPLTGGTLKNGSNNTPLILNTSATEGDIGIKFCLNNANKGWIGYNNGYGTYLYTYTGPHRLGIKDNGVAYCDSHPLLHSGNYTSYTPILNSTSTHATNTSVIYAPSTAGTKDLVLLSNGSGAPYWTNLSNLKISSLIPTTILSSGSNKFNYVKFASINLTSRYSGMYAILKLTHHFTTSTDYGTSCDLYVHCYQLDPIGTIPRYTIKTNNDDSSFTIVGIVNYSSTSSTLDLYVHGKSWTYLSINVLKLAGDNIINIGTNIETLPSGTQVIPLKTGHVDIANSVKNALTFASGAFATKTYNGSSAVTVNIPTKTSHLTNDSGYLTSRGYWADVAVSASSNTSTTPTFGATVRLNSSISGAGSDVILEWWRGTNASWRALNTGGILKFQSNYTSSAGSYYDCFNISYNTGNTWSKGLITAAGFVKEGSSNSYVLLGGGGHKALSDFLLESELATQELSANLTTITKSLTVTADWMDTGIAYNNLPSNGTYIVLVYVHAPNSSIWECYWSGVMTWHITSSTNSRTNDEESDEIILHRSGHGYDNTIYLRTKMTKLTSHGGTSEGLKLLIAANKNIGAAYTYTFKFKRII